MPMTLQLSSLMLPASSNFDIQQCVSLRSTDLSLANQSRQLLGPLSMSVLGIFVLQIWRVYQRGLERWIADLLQPVFDNLVSDGMVPRYVQVSTYPHLIKYP